MMKFNHHLRLLPCALGLFASCLVQATALAKKAFDWETTRTDLKRTWLRKFATVVPAKKAAQFFRIENQLHAALDLRLAAALPLIQ